MRNLLASVKPSVKISTSIAASQSITRVSKLPTLPRRKVLSLGMGMAFSLPVRKAKAESIPIEISYLDSVNAIQAGVIKKLIVDHITSTHVNLNSHKDRYVLHLLSAYDIIVSNIENELLKNQLRMELATIISPNNSCLKNRCI
jgi:hypothetical protein